MVRELNPNHPDVTGGHFLEKVHKLAVRDLNRSWAVDVMPHEFCHEQSMPERVHAERGASLQFQSPNTNVTRAKKLDSLDNWARRGYASEKYLHSPGSTCI